ncbi:MAG: NAD(P)/FAD-dependent oxidoreductase, partial [Anaerolineales bacterium]|nr:NAD(P)/FAD-dependent oxidoreductase [Anaerolineales bacterium]
MYDIIVLGGGPAGVTAALRASELGADIALVEQGRLGGTCTNDGCVPTRFLAHTARLAREAEQFTDYGLVAELPQVDFSRLISRTQAKINELHEKKQLANHLGEFGVKVFTDVGAAEFVDPATIKTAGGMQLEAEKFILCAGGRARRFSFPGSELALIHSDVWSLSSLPKSVAIVGGAATGCQLASILAAFGAKVILLDIASHLLGTEDTIISETISDSFVQRGIEIVTDIGGVERIEEQDKELVLWYTSQDQVKQVASEAVILATGWPGNADTLNLAAVGVESERGYVLV